jgi:hypothetical protein
MRRAAVKLAVAVLLLAIAACAAAVPGATAAAGPSGAPIPPALAALEQKMLALQITSESFSLSESVQGPAGPPSGPLGQVGLVLAHRAVSQVIVGVSGQESFEPVQASFQESVLGQKINGRLIGTTLYTESPPIASIDGGRPWVSQTGQSLGLSTGAGSGLLAGAPANASQPSFLKLTELLGLTNGITESPAQTVDGQATSVFSASIDLARIPALSSPGKRTVLKKLQLVAALQVFIAEDGLPVRTVITVKLKPDRGRVYEIVTQSDLLAIDIPVSVQAPPTSQTISLRRLKQIEKRRKRSLKRSSASGKSK